MGKVDALAKNYVKNKKVFADAFNYYMYNGRRVIDPDRLYEVDTTEITVPYGEDDSGIKIQPVQKIRDVIYSVMSDSENRKDIRRSKTAFAEGKSSVM
ncbi:MAG: hypothetical protein LUH47_02795 [Clostridiales bacterium]|nr:hypothetical protein [Clostridiales bacterium]